MSILLVVLYILVCIFLVLVVLLQQGKGADLAGAFGGGGSQTSFGPRTASNIMHRMTTGSFVLFVVLSLALAILSGKQRTSVMDAVETTAPAAIEATQEEVQEPAMVPVVDETAAETDAAATDETAADEAEGEENTTENE